MSIDGMPPAGPAARAMRCLWITLTDPDPALDGQHIYSGGLIRSLAAAGVDVTVLAMSRADGAHTADAPSGPADSENAAVAWCLAPDRRRRSSG